MSLINLIKVERQRNFMSSPEQSDKTAEAHFQDGLAFSKLGDDRRTFESYKQAIELDPDHFLAHFNLGVRLGKLRMNLEASKSFREALRLKPEAPMVHYSLAVVSNFIGEFEDAFKHYKEAIRINPEFGRAHSNLAMLYYGVKSGKEAIHHLSIAADLFKQTSDEFMEKNARDLIQECGREFRLTPEDCKTL
jgi:tetratricopeptide (TPR) repeat protein